jgi:hypothetical protein
MVELMTPAAFKSSTSQVAPPDDLSAPLEGLWWAAKGDWDRAHKVVQKDDGADAAWVHAYLHRVEGDLPNARYWYHQATRPEAKSTLDDEWNSIAEVLLAGNSKA